MKKLIAIFSIAIIVVIADDAAASTCGASTNADGISSSTLKRQLSALHSIQRARGCDSNDATGGLFNACRDVAMQISRVRQMMGEASGGGRECREAATAGRKMRTGRRRDVATAGAGGGPGSAASASAAGAARAGASERARAARQTEPGRRARRTAGSGHALSYCVRLSDGYYFPTPNSQFRQKGGTDAALTQCQVICETPDMAVYVLRDRDDETTEMVSVADGRPYNELATAYFYHDDNRAFKRCRWNRYVARIDRGIVTQKVTRRLEGVDIPVPDEKPDEPVRQMARVQAAPAYGPMPDRPVRMVGPAFIPDAGVRKESMSR